jgi:hypothetical protein
MRLAILAVLLSAMLVSSAPASASILAVGGTQFPVSAEEGPTSATLIAGGVAVPFAGLQYTGELISAVYNNDTSNPFGMDKLTFTYELSNDATSAHELHRFTIPGFANTQTDVSFTPLVPPVGPARITPALADRLPPDVVGFAFVDGHGYVSIGPGRRSQTLVIQTDATAFAPVTASVIDGSVATVSSFAPVTAIPEPSALVLLVAGGGALEALCVVRRVRQRSMRRIG